MSSGIDPVLERHLKPTANFGRVPEEGCFFRQKLTQNGNMQGKACCFGSALWRVTAARYQML
ncbi:unnamed protein product [Brucella canis str. Oliveri]|nr:unnamed protein product [Brucella canis str. Oliveri]